VSGQGGSTEERNLPPSKKKLQDARLKGKIATSRAFMSAVGTVVAIEYIAFRGHGLVALEDTLISDASTLSQQPFNEAYPALVSHAAWGAAMFLLPLMVLVPISVFVASVIGNKGFVFSAVPLQPKLERLDPTEGVKRIFSQRNLVNSGELIFKFLAIAIGAFVILRLSAGALVQLPACGSSCLPGFTRRFFGSLITYVSVLFITIGVIDILIQRYVFWKEMHMTRTERRRERKEAEGSGLAKQARKQRQQGSLISNVRMGLQNATFVIHGEDIAVAMAYSAANAPVPTLVARATDSDADILLTEARAMGLPCILNKSAATQVAAKLQMGDTIPKSLFVPVIECMRRAGVL
jgi:type III secretion protein U